MMSAAELPFLFPLPPDEIIQRRAEILTSLCQADPDFRSVPIMRMRAKTMKRMLCAYDQSFLQGFLAENLPSLKVTASSRLLVSAGKFCCTKKPSGSIQTAEIRMSSDFFSRMDTGPFSVGGLSVPTPQEAFLLVFEHELCHAVEILLYQSTGHSSRFLSLANGLFGHTTTKHKLPTRRQDAAASGLRIGSQVAFPYQSTYLTGRITYIGKTVTVMVPDAKGDYRDDSGRRYAKYRVPLSLLQQE